MKAAVSTVRFGSKSDLEAREWLIRYWKEHLGIETRIDAAANLWVDYQKREGCFAVGYRFSP